MHKRAAPIQLGSRRSTGANQSFAPLGMHTMPKASVELCRRKPYTLRKAPRLLAREGEKKGVERSS